ncbi:MAG: alanine racemase [Kofleriaceae bacterium]
MDHLLVRYGSPLYVYDADLVRTAYARFVTAFAYRPLDVHYAIVCNKNRYLVRMLAELGAGIHANTPGDAFAALAAGVSAERILYSGTNLDAHDFSFLREHGIRMNLDSLDQLRDVCRIGGVRELGLRLLIDDDDRPNRIGVTLRELSDALALASATGVRLTGLHMYAGTNTRTVQRFVDCLDRLIAASDMLPDLAWIDLGGGFGLPYSETDRELPLTNLGAAVSERLRRVSDRRGREITLVVEPGRYLVGAAGSLLTRVVSVKQREGRRYVGVDTTVGNLVVPSVYHTRHRIEVVDHAASLGPVLDVPTDVCGNTTHSRDYLARNVRLPAVQPGDVLRLCDVGAYGYAMSSHFLNRPRPAEVVIDRGAEHLTTRRETFADLLATHLQS